MTKKETAIRTSIKHWEQLAITGENKSSIPELTNYHNKCPLCHYVKDVSGASVGAGESNCMKYCPYVLHFGFDCQNPRSAFNGWQLDGSLQSRKKAASQFVIELKQLLKGEKEMPPKTTLKATYTDADRECDLEELFDCYSEGEYYKFTFNDKTITVCEDCKEKVSELFKKFDIQVNYIPC